VPGCRGHSSRPRLVADPGTRPMITLARTIAEVHEGDASPPPSRHKLRERYGVDHSTVEIECGTPAPTGIAPAEVRASPSRHIRSEFRHGPESAFGPGRDPRRNWARRVAASSKRCGRCPLGSSVRPADIAARHLLIVDAAHCQAPCCGGGRRRRRLGAAFTRSWPT